MFGYPKLTFGKVRRQIEEKKEGKQQERKKNMESEKSKGMIVIPYGKCVTEQLKGVFSKNRITTSLKTLPDPEKHAGASKV